MKPKNLISTVKNILKKKVTEEEAKEFALKNYGVLAAYIRSQYIKSLTIKN